MDSFYDYMIGNKYGHLTVLSFSHKNTRKDPYYFCKCDCGSIKLYAVRHIKSGATKSCGKCVFSSHFRHGLSKTCLANLLADIKQRCYNKNTPFYKYYGGRGITVSEIWKGKNGTFNFCKWAVDNGYKKGLTIDRIDNDKGYSPENCRWVERQANMNNRNCTIFIDYNNEKLPLSDFSRKYNIKRKFIYDRIKQGINIEKIIKKYKEKIN